MNKFNIGDKVKVVKYGSIHYFDKNNPPLHNLLDNLPIYKEQDNIILYDSNKGIVGMEGIIEKWGKVQGMYDYAVKGIPSKYAWYDEEQLEMVSKNPNFE